MIEEILAGGRVNTAAEWQAYVERFHDERPTANEFFTLLETGAGRTSYELTAQAVANLGPRHVLEIACGEGNLAEPLFGCLAPHAYYTGIDISASEIDVARERFRAERRATFVRADACVLPFSSRAIDVVTAHQFFNFLPDPLPALRETARVLAPGGSLVMASHRGWFENPKLTWKTLHRAALSALRKQYPGLAWPPLMHDPRIYTDEGIREILASAHAFDMQTVRFDHYSVGATLTADRIAAIYNRLYVFATVPDRSFVQEALARTVAALAGDDDVLPIDIPFRMVIVQKRR